jgi:hypothetical protein
MMPQDVPKLRSCLFTIWGEVNVQELKDLLLQRHKLLMLLFFRGVSPRREVAESLKPLPKVKQRGLIRGWSQSVICDYRGELRRESGFCVHS